MSQAFFLSYVMLWVLVILCVGTLLYVIQTTSKQMHHIRESYALKEEIGLSIGATLPKLEVQTSTGHALQLILRKEKTLLLFASTNCHVCFEFYPQLVRFYKKHGHWNINLLILGDLDAVNQIIQKHDLAIPCFQITHVILEQLSVKKLPFANLVSEKGILVKKQIVRTEEELNEIIS